MIPWLNDHRTLRRAHTAGRLAGNSEFIQILTAVEEKQNPKARKRSSTMKCFRQPSPDPRMMLNLPME